MNAIQKRLLRDAREAATDAIVFVGDNTPEDFESNKLVRYAVNYALIIVGEALNAASDHGNNSALTDAIPELRAIIATRHRIAHEYDGLDIAIIWSIVADRLPKLIAQIEGALGYGEPLG